MTDILCGGWSPIKLFTPEMKKICCEVRPEIEKRVGPNFKIYIPVVYSSQFVAGTNYMVKVLVDVDRDAVCFHAKIFEPLPCDGRELNVTEVQFHKTIDDPLTPF